MVSLLMPLALQPIYYHLQATLLTRMELEVGGQKFTFEYHNCGDFAAMSKVYGLLGPTSTFPCLW